MTAMIKTLAAGALQDRKGVTALEYALIAAAIVSVVLVAYNAMFGKLKTFVEAVSFS